MAKARTRSRPRIRGLRIRIPTRRWRIFLLLVIGGPALITSIALAYYYVQFSQIIQARLHGERDRVIPRVFARPLALHGGQGMNAADLITRLNDIGYTERSRVDRPGEFAVSPGTITVLARGGDHAGKIIRVLFPQPRAVKDTVKAALVPPRIDRLEVGKQAVDEVTL